MTTARFRPTFSLDTKLKSTELVERVKQAVTANPSEFQGQFTADHALISIVESKRHFWSPWLHLELRQFDSRNEVFGRFSPHPNIWTGFMFSYFSLLVVTFFSLVIGWSQRLAGESCWVFYLVPVWLLIGLLLWIASQMGQRLAVAEMQRLQSLVQDCLLSDPEQDS